MDNGPSNATRQLLPEWRWDELDRAIVNWKRCADAAKKSPYRDDSQKAKTARAEVHNLIQDLELEVAIVGPPSRINDAFAKWVLSLTEPMRTMNLDKYLERPTNGRGGRPPGVNLSKFEEEAIDLYCQGMKPKAIDARMGKQQAACRGKGKEKTSWMEGNAALVIRAAKERVEIVKTSEGWKRVRE
jgi:hypothetical protein